MFCSIAPSGPPNNVRGFILNATSIKVNWTNSSETNGYVIEYTTGGITRNVVSTSEDEIVLTDLSPMSTYTISVYSYIDLPSVNSTIHLMLLRRNGWSIIDYNVSVLNWHFQF